MSNLKLNCLAAACSALSSLCDPCDESFVRLLALALLRVRTPHLLAQLRYVSRFATWANLESPELGGALTIAKAAAQYLALLDPLACGAAAEW